MIVDVEELRRKQASAMRQLRDIASEAGPAAVVARLGLATSGVDDWLVEELRRGTSRADIATAVMTRAAGLVAAQVASFQPASDPRVQNVRIALLTHLEVTIRTLLGRFDTMSAEETDANSIHIHTPQ